MDISIILPSQGQNHKALGLVVNGVILLDRLVFLISCGVLKLFSAIQDSTRRITESEIGMLAT
jgi:hypothetical protein